VQAHRTASHERSPPSEVAQLKGESRTRPTTSFALLGYPRSRKNGGHSGGFHAVLPGPDSSGVPQGATLFREWGGAWSEAELASSGIAVSGRRSRA